MLLRIRSWVRRRRSKGPVPAARLRPARDVLGAERDGLVVLLDLRREVYLGLDEVGTTIWRAIETGARLHELPQRVAEEYDAPPELIERDTMRFVDDLVTRRLIIVT